MIIAFDTFYGEDKSLTAYAKIADWSDATIYESGAFELVVKADYEPGNFYKRELPCILNAIEQMDLSDIEFIIVDGYVVLDDDGKKGLGGYLFEALDQKVKIIGVAKNKFQKNKSKVSEIYRGQSEKPLFVTSLGIEHTEAAALIQQMDGAYRFPTVLRAVDQLSRGRGVDRIQSTKTKA